VADAAPHYRALARSSIGDGYRRNAPAEVPSSLGTISRRDHRAGPVLSIKSVIKSKPRSNGTPDAWPAWLGEEPTDPSQLKALLAPCPSEPMTCWPVSARIGNVKNNDASLIEPIAA